MIYESNVSQFFDELIPANKWMNNVWVVRQTGQDLWQKFLCKTALFVFLNWLHRNVYEARHATLKYRRSKAMCSIEIHIWYACWPGNVYNIWNEDSLLLERYLWNTSLKQTLELQNLNSTLNTRSNLNVGVFPTELTFGLK